MSNTVGVLLKAGTAYPWRAHGFRPDVWWGPCCSSFTFCLSSSSVLCSHCCQCFWIVHFL